ncbi:AraC family transcriptional regulator [Chitinophaga sp. Cy-1792]|uniref:AraC family transcriptional regulator n=1 Tax=Chitinophaga sp. Cy-1792 TaxID=2608339 RepID=UPI00142003A0|nr:AraC family transcriptional regulator [Chitinophaga sp. Cy-1792]NIG55612.1 AraC family transcriptional regulator [Chitinophaga sp. Cy-1792]
MKRYKQFEPVLVSDFELSEWHHPVHNHNHYELIYIQHGSGLHMINDVSAPYQPGNIYLLGPEDHHLFHITTATRFIYLKFTDAYLYESAGLPVQDLEYLLKSRETHQAGYLLPAPDATTARLLFEVVSSLKQDILANQDLLRMQILSLAQLLKRNMPELKATGNRSRDMQAVYCYIHKNIYEPDLLKAPAIAAHFNLSAEYVGPFFKRNTGTTLSHYIQQYRNTLIRQRLTAGRFSLKEIALEFGLTDASHVSKIMHKEY